MSNNIEFLKKTVLAVDDMPDILDSIIACLKSDYIVYALTSPTEALKFLLSHIPDVIILDIYMPGMDGYTLLDIIRKMENFQLTPVLFLTANATVANVIRASQLGMVDFITKPVNKEILLTRIEALFDNQPENKTLMRSDEI